MTSSRWLPALVVATALVSILLSGCGSSTAGEDGEMRVLTFEEIKEQAEQMHSSVQMTILEDDTVSPEELRTSVDSFATCLKAKGLEFHSLGPNPVDGWRPLYEVFWPGKADDEGTKLSDDCYDATLFLVIFGYELSNEEIMEPAFMAELQECAASAEVVLTGREKNLKDIMPLGEEDPNAAAVLGCVRSIGATYDSGFVLAY